MNELVVCTYCDRAAGTLDEYRSQLSQAGIALHVEQISPFPDPAHLPATFKLHWMREFALRFRDYRRLVFTDAFDVLFVGSLDQAVAAIPDGVLWGAEQNCYPEPGLADSFPQTGTPWRYVNAGVMGGSPEAILDWVEQARQHPRSDEMGMLDQGWLNRRRAENSLVEIDSNTTAFYVVSSTLERGDLQMKDGRPWNSRCDTYPSWFHFSGSCPTDSFRNLLASV